MPSIYRQNLPATDYQEIEVTGEPISVAASRDGSSGTFDLWYEHHGFESYTVAIYVIGTGNPVPWSQITRWRYKFLGTVVTPSGLVWHVYTGPRQIRAGR